MSQPASLPSEPLPFVIGQVVTMTLPVQIEDISTDGEHLMCRVLRPWGGYKYWSCTTNELAAVTKP
jgi:hypothetical protein